MDLASRFGRSNRTRLFQVQCELYSLYQGTLLVKAFYTKCKRIWDEYQSLVEEKVYTCGSNTAILSLLEEQRVVQFLMGLNEFFVATRAHILMMDPSPDMSTVYQLVTQEEEQRPLTNYGSTFDNESLDLAASGSTSNRGGSSS